MKNRLRIIRAEKNITQETLAEMSGLSRATINGIENGTTNAKSETLVKIANALGMPIGEIFFNESVV